MVAQECWSLFRAVPQTTTFNSYRWLVGCDKINRNGDQSAIVNLAAKKSRSDHKQDCAPESAKSVTLIGFVLGHLRPKWQSDSQLAGQLCLWVIHNLRLMPLSFWEDVVSKTMMGCRKTRTIQSDLPDVRWRFRANRWYLCKDCSRANLFIGFRDITALTSPGSVVTSVAIYTLTMWFSIPSRFPSENIRFSTSGHSLIWFRWGAVSTWFCGSWDNALWRWESISGHLFALNKGDDLIFQGRWCQFSSICLLSQVFHA